jgi:hypothetical protein
MVEIILPTTEKEEEQPEEIVCNYAATQDDEEKYLLTYLLHMQPSEVDALDTDRRRWILGRLIAQKNIEREQFAQARILSQLGPNLRAE